MSPDKKRLTKKRIGVFVCHCGKNIAETVDVAEVAKITKDLHGVVFSTDSKYLCSEPGQKEILDAVRAHNLDSLICACCSPTLHEETFRLAAEKAGKAVVWKTETFTIDLCMAYLQKREQEPLLQAVLNSIFTVWGTVDQGFTVHPSL